MESIVKCWAQLVFLLWAGVPPPGFFVYFAPSVSSLIRGEKTTFPAQLGGGLGKLKTPGKSKIEADRWVPPVHRRPCCKFIVPFGGFVFSLAAGESLGGFVPGRIPPWHFPGPIEISFVDRLGENQWVTPRRPSHGAQVPDWSLGNTFASCMKLARHSLRSFWDLVGAGLTGIIRGPRITIYGRRLISRNRPAKSVRESAKVFEPLNFMFSAGGDRPW